jgi:hypothetical protein
LYPFFKPFKVFFQNLEQEEAAIKWQPDEMWAASFMVQNAAITA